MYRPFHRRGTSSARAFMACLLLLGPLTLAGCTGGEEAPAPGGSLDVVVQEPASPATVGAALALTLRVMGDGAGPERLGLAWANASTQNIDDRLLVEEAFDGILWTQGAARLPAETLLTIEEIPDEPFLYIRGVVEKDGHKTWGKEVRVVVRSPQPPLDLEARLKNLPRETYGSNLHTLRVNVTGDPAEASRIGVSWSRTPVDRELETLRPDRFEGTHAIGGSFPLPGEVRLPTWLVPTNTSIHLRAWVLVDGTHHWSAGYIVDVTDPPLYDHKTAGADHTVTINASGLPLPHLDAFTPQEIHIRKGESVRWVNQADAIHSASRDENGTSFHTGNLGPGAASDVFRFLVPGEYSYRCRLHPETMEAVLVVTDQAA